MSLNIAVTPDSDLGVVEVNYRRAIVRALGDELRLNPSVVLLGEDIGAAGGVFKTTAGLRDEFGDRVRDTPISEQAIIGATIGAAVSGLRPVAEIMFADFAGVCFDQIANSLAKYRYTTNGQVSVPVTIRLANGAGSGFGAQHSQSVENWFLNIPGLKIAVPGTVEDVYGMLRAAIQDDDPVLIFEHKSLFNVKGSLPARALPGWNVPLGVASIPHPGTEVTVVATQLMRHRAIAAAEHLGHRGISVEVLDPRTLIPFDYTAVAESLKKTSRLVVVQEGPRAGGWGATLVAHMVTDHMDLLDAPPALATSDEIPVPYALVLEEASMPSIERIEQEIQRVLTY